MLWVLVRSWLVGMSLFWHCAAFSGRIAQIFMFWRVGLFEFALVVSVVRVSSAFSTFLSPTLVVALDLFGIRSSLVGHVGPLGFRGLPI